jgi:mono/diheme cytochrome c family protein
MRSFVIGFAAAILVVFLAVFGYLRLGLFDPRADVAIGGLESKIAMPSLDAAVDRRAPDIKDPLQPTDDNLIAGMKIYQQDCASCHGDVNRPHSALADAFYPRAPQFVEDAPDMPENQNFYIIDHGIRLSGMPAWIETLNDQQMWQVTAFLNHMDKLSPQVSDAWKGAAGGADTQRGSQNGSKTEMKEMKGMGMPKH